MLLFKFIVNLLHTPVSIFGLLKNDNIIVADADDTPA